MSRPYFTHTTISDDSALGGAVIERSLRFNDDDGAYLERTPSSAGNRKKWTFSAWIKRSKFGVEQRIFGGDANASHIFISTDDKFRWDLANEGSSSASATLRTNAAFRDPSAWYHLVCALDTDNSTADNRMRMYVNGTEITSFAARTNPSSGYATNAINAASVHTIGRRTSAQGSDGMRYDGYITEINFINGQQYDPSFFGYTESQTGLWRPKRYEGTYGTNGFHLEFKNNSSTSTLGKDTSGNGNDFTTNNFSVAAGAGNDSLEDTPTNNFCTYNPLDSNSGITFSQGNLVLNTSQGFDLARSTFFLSSGKWYWEVTCDDTGSGFIGVSDQDDALNNRGGSNATSCTIRSTNGDKRINSSNSSYGSAISDGDVMIFALDMDNGKFWAGKNGTFFNSGDPATGSNAATSALTKPVSPSVSLYDNEDYTANFGQRAFSYTPPTGYQSLCSKNLIPNVSSIIRPKKHFDTLLYTGNNNTSQNITGLEFQPDLVWVKNRDNVERHHWVDSVRGNNKVLFSNVADGERTGSHGSGHTQLNLAPNGFNLVSNGSNDELNFGTRTYAAWCWKAGGAAVTNNDGSIASQVSANTEAGFSIVTYTGTGSAGTVGHGLGKVPEVIITKRRDGSGEWTIYHKDLDHASSTSHRVIRFNTSAQTGSSALYYGNDPTSTVQHQAAYTDLNGSGETYVSYNFSGVKGYSKFGKYTGNGNANGTFVFCGFRPAVVILKAISFVKGWRITDSTRSSSNPIFNSLFPELTSAEYTATGSNQQGQDFLSNGFKLRNTNDRDNKNGETYIYLAFAEQPGITSYNTQTNAR